MPIKLENVGIAVRDLEATIGQPRCSIATRQTPSASLRQTRSPRTTTFAGSLPSGPLTHDPRIHTAARLPRPSVRSGRIETDAKGRMDLAIASSASRPRQHVRHHRRTPHLRCSCTPRRSGRPPARKPRDDAPLLGSRTRRTLRSAPCAPRLRFLAACKCGRGSTSAVSRRNGSPGQTA